MKNMDDKTDINYSVIEERYISDCAKYNFGDIVYFENNDNTMTIGVIHARKIKLHESIRKNKVVNIRIIHYDIITPTGIYKDISEVKIMSASKFIYRQFFNENA